MGFAVICALRRIVAGAALLPLLLATREVRAGDAHSIDWSAPAGCPDGAAVAQRVEALLDGRGDSLIEAHVRVTRVGDRYRSVVQVRTARGQGERVLETATCAAAGEMSAIVIAMSAAPGLRLSGGSPAALQAASAPAGDAIAVPARADVPPGAAAAAPALAAQAPVSPAPVGQASPSPAVGSDPSLPASPAPDAQPSQPPSPSPSPSPAPVTPDVVRSPGLALPVPTSARGRRLFLAGAGVAADTGSLPDAGIGPSLMLAARPLPELTVELSGSYWPAQTARLTGTIGGRIDLLDASLRSCYEARLRGGLARLAPGGCVGLFVDRLHAEGFGAPQNMQQDSVHGGPLASASLRFAVLEWLGVRLLVEGALPLSRQSFTVNGLGGSVHNPAAVAGRSVLATEASF
jgi:hypothetical protein